MRLTHLALFVSSLLLSQFSFAAACPASTTSTSSGSAFGTDCTVTGSASTIQLNFKNGFADSTAISAVGGNGGTTVGAQRKLSFIKAAEILADQVQSSQVIEVDADFTALFCTTSSATLGSAGATTNLGNVANPMPAGSSLNTFYPVGLINAIGATDYHGGSDITAQFNANIGTTNCLQSSSGWYYGFDAPPSGYIGFTTVLLHEMTHGLGFASLTDANTGAKASGIDDIFSNFLYSAAAAADWKAANTSNAERAASAISVTGLLWNGSNVNTQAVGVLTAGYQDNDSSGTFTSGDRVQMYAPNPVEGGSSVSHFNTAASPNELMEPQYTEGQMDLGLALYLLEDIGWGITAPSSNTAPVIAGIPDLDIKDGEFKDITLTGYATDVDGDSLTFSDTACGANLTCTFPSANVIRVAASGGVGTTVTVTVEADDGNGGTNTDSFDVSIISAVPSTTIAVDGTTYNDTDTLSLPLGSTQINVNNGTGSYSYDLDFKGNDVSSLISANANGLTIGLPSSGEFAGDYTLTITDSGDGDVITLTIKRPLRLSWSTTSILNGDTSQSLKIEGGAAGTNYTLLQSGTEDLIFRNSNGAAVASAIAANDADSFNAAVIKLDSHTVTAITSMDVTVQSTYDDVVETGVKVYPASTHSFTVTDAASSAISTATAELNRGETLLSELNLALSYSADANGQFTVNLPDTAALTAGSNFAMTISASGYQSESLSLDSNQTTHNVTLTEMTNGITLTGSISALGSQDFKADAPVVKVTFADGTSESVTVSVSTISQASFSHEVDLNTQSLSTLSISQADSLSIDMDISFVSQDQSFNILLERNVVVVSSAPTQIGGGGSSGGGSLSLGLLLLMALWLYRPRYMHPAKQAA